jgi:predicted PhzF superfamily epimerase YddE/YHI9
MDYVAVYRDAQAVFRLAPDMEGLRRLDRRGVIVTAPGLEVDYVLRFFAPKAGVPEDPATGSAQCLLAPYWSVRLKKPELTARQLSLRGGDLRCEVKGDRVLISGRSKVYSQGEICL